MEDHAPPGEAPQTLTTSPLTPATEPPAADTADTRHTTTTPIEHRRNRKSWTEEEKRTFWKQKKQEKKERKRAAAADRQRALQVEWEGLSESEREARKAEAAEIHERRRVAEAAILQRCETQLADPHVPALVFDLSFAWCMTVSDTKSTVAQVKFSYSALRNAGFPFRPVVSSLLGKEPTDGEHDTSRQRAVLQALLHFEGFRRFPPQLTEDAHWSTLFPTDRVVFLTADAPEVLTAMAPDTAYIIGAFVDHNQHKGLSYAAAQRHGVRSARLPIKESLDIGNRCKVLTINHVVDVLVRYEALRAAGTPNWSRAIDDALPTRRTQQGELGVRKRRRVTAIGSAPESEGSDSDEEPADE